MGFAPGTRLDRYIVEGILGQGGMAIVYKVRHAQLGTFHALKVLNTPSPQVRDRMLREGRVQGSLRHPNIVPVTDLVEISGSPGLVMEFVDGPTLESLLERYRPTLQQADALATAILESVAYAHRKGFIHRDLKPANVLLANSATGLVPKVTDFGLAKMMTSDEPAGMHHTRSGVIMGTPAYMAPEQIRDSKHVDQRADVFSLGVMLYELISGRKPFVGEDIVKLYTAITSGTYRPIQELVPNVPERMERAIVGALAIDRNQRIQDCDRLLAIWKGDQSSRRSSTEEERKRAQSTNTAVPDLPEPFFPESSGDVEKEITFHDDGGLPIPANPTTKNHWLLSDLSNIKIAAPDFAAIAPNSDVPDEPRVIIPVVPQGNLPSIAPVDLYDEASFAPRSGLYVAVGALAIMSLLAGLGLAYAWVGMETSNAAPPPPPEVVPAEVDPPAPAPEPPAKPRGRSGTPRTTPPKSTAPPTAPSAESAPLTVEDVGVATEGAAPPVDTPPGDR